MDSQALIQTCGIENTGKNGQRMKIPLGSLIRFKSDENNILQLAIHLISNWPIYYLLFDWSIPYGLFVYGWFMLDYYDYCLTKFKYLISTTLL